MIPAMQPTTRHAAMDACDPLGGVTGRGVDPVEETE
jgi:hypothetical protein